MEVTVCLESPHKWREGRNAGVWRSIDVMDNLI